MNPGCAVAVGSDKLLEMRYETMLDLVQEHKIYAAYFVDVTMAMCFVLVATSIVVWCAILILLL